MGGEMTSNDEMERDKVKADLWRYRNWYSNPEQEELRKSCAEGWGWLIWQAALKSKQGEV